MVAKLHFRTKHEMCGNRYTNLGRSVCRYFNLALYAARQHHTSLLDALTPDAYILQNLAYAKFAELSFKGDQMLPSNRQS